MTSLTIQALSELKFYLNQHKVQHGVCITQGAICTGLSDLLNAAPVTTFYYYQNSVEMQRSNLQVVRGESYALPFITDSIDIIVVWHNFDFHRNPDKVIKELWRILAPNGILLMIGANNPSFFSDKDTLNKKIKYKTAQKPLLLNKRSIIIRSLLHYGFAIDIEKTFGFRTENLVHWLDQLSMFFEVIAQFCCPMFGATYLIQARKPILGLNFPLPVDGKKFLFRPKVVTESAYSPKNINLKNQLK